VALHDLSTEEMLSQIGEKKLQVALTVRPPAKLLRGLNIEELAHYTICVAVAPKHPLAKSKSISLEQISREPLLGYSRKDYPEYHEMLEKLFASIGRKPRIVGEHDGVTSIVAAVEAGHGFALVPSCVACMVGGSPQGPRLKLIPLKPALPAIPVVAIWRKESETELIEEFIAAAREEKGQP
ncbi:MAG TPA: LysR family substrate-binding domain-containing protein, partial [Methylomirabilota bacterium]|nr:LysR family substrate-binding domain-containing protein [Methylomirabilota bacterium]